MHKISWILKMAWRDFRKSSARLVLFVAAMVLGVAAIVAIYSFGKLLRADIARQGKELLGADLVLSNNRPLDSLTFAPEPIAEAAEVNFASMVAFPQTGESRLTQVRALEGNFPFYGKLETVPEAAEQTFRAGGARALVEKTLMAQFGAQVGDSIQVGNRRFRIEGLLEKVPGQTGITATVAPAVYIPMAYVEETGLIQYGSRLNYERYFQFEESVDVGAWCGKMIRLGSRSAFEPLR
ncbi:ABC transporter permease [Nitritalea halalkaliphila]|uniref:ABC transporter permease n=1 Tax=Nitritalea halalkaliphila TaxID=590849 RepID=UPI0029341169|nr:ABC transporter permease [Nitritalea halalkaliphila]